MADWKVLVVVLFGIICLGLVIATIVVPLALTDEEYRWVWFGGLVVATVGMGSLFTLFLRSADRNFARDSARRDR